MTSGRVVRRRLPAIRVALVGHLTVASLDEAMRPTESLDRPHSVVVDVTAMTGYDAAARHAFVGWNQRHRDDLPRVAVVTDKVLWRTVVAAIAMASRQNLRAFGSMEQALDWACSG